MLSGHAEWYHHHGELGMAHVSSPDLKLGCGVLGHQTISRENEWDEATIGEESDLCGVSSHSVEVFE